ncbi:hypothetical protein ABT297_33075 [Dactylosporangium sp. NPDC000555]
MTSTDQKPSTSVADRRQWQAPRVECLETRPEISAYSGTADPWHRRPR